MGDDALARGLRDVGSDAQDDAPGDGGWTGRGSRGRRRGQGRQHRGREQGFGGLAAGEEMARELRAIHGGRDQGPGAPAGERRGGGIEEEQEQARRRRQGRGGGRDVGLGAVGAAAIRRGHDQAHDVEEGAAAHVAPEGGGAQATPRRRSGRHERSGPGAASADDGGGGGGERSEGHGRRNTEAKDQPRVVHAGEAGQSLAAPAAVLVPALQHAREMGRRRGLAAQESAEAAHRIRRSDRRPVVEGGGREPQRPLPPVRGAGPGLHERRPRPPLVVDAEQRLVHEAGQDAIGRPARRGGLDGGRRLRERDAQLATVAGPQRRTRAVARAQGQREHGGAGGDAAARARGEPHLRSATSNSATRNPPPASSRAAASQALAPWRREARARTAPSTGTLPRRWQGGGVAVQQDAVAHRRADRGWRRRSAPATRARGRGRRGAAGPRDPARPGATGRRPRRPPSPLPAPSRAADPRCRDPPRRGGSYPRGNARPPRRAARAARPLDAWR